MPNPEFKYLTSLPVFAGDEPPSGPRTVVCMGTARGGTSMVAGAILGLGVPMGSDLTPNLEDREFNMDMRVGSPDEFFQSARNVIATRNAEHSVWGWKFPHTVRYLRRLIGDLRAPHLVCVFRDPVPMALRSRKTEGMALDFVADRLRMQLLNSEMIEELGLPCLMVSYEKAAAHPLVFVHELANFLGLPIPADTDEIVSFMTPGTYKDPGPLLARLNSQD